jgi:hypothetical protein
MSEEETAQERLRRALLGFQQAADSAGALAVEVAEAEIVANTNEPPPLRPHEIETIKLRATYLNGLAIAIFGVGALAPIVKVFDGESSQPMWPIASAALVCILISFGLHWLATNVLKGLTR